MTFRTVNTGIPDDLPKLFLGDNEIKYVDHTEFLGVTITKHLSWKAHMVSIKKKLRKNLGACRKIKSQLGKTAMVSLYHSLIECHVRRNIVSWCHGNVTMKNSIQRSCDNFLKLIYSNANPLEIRQIRKDFELLSVDQILFHEIGMLMLKLHNKSLPTCFDEFFTETSHPMSTRSRRAFNLDQPRIQLTKQSLNYKGALVWNKIPNNVKYVKGSSPPHLFSNDTFKKNLKEFLLVEGPVSISLYLTEMLYSNQEL